MGEPPVCILMPCLNARRFLEPRAKSLQEQTFTGWEALVLDSGSDDGSWEFFEEVAAGDARFHLHRIPREGLYAALNRGIDMARGEFLHIATCDDTATPDFLDRMLEAFARAPEAGVAVCDLEFIDEHGEATVLAGQRLGASHVRTPIPGEEPGTVNFRPSPHDSLLYLAGDNVYFSLTQLLVRTSLARRAPRFMVDKGSYADFGWSMGLACLAGTVHIPRKLSAWRMHGDQLSVRQGPAHVDDIPAMCQAGLDAIHREHRTLLSRNDRAALLIPAKLLRAEATGRPIRRLLIWLEGVVRLGWMGVERPAATLHALLGVRLFPRHLKQVWIAFMLRRLRLQPRKTG